MAYQKELKTKSDYDIFLDKIKAKINSNAKNKGLISKSDLVFPLKLREILENPETNNNVCFIRLKPIFSKVNVNTSTKKSKTITNTLSITSIILPIMPVEDVLTNQWSSVEGAQLLTGGMSLGKLGKYGAWKMKKALAAVLPEEVAVAVRSGVFGGALDNPYDKIMYGGHQRRSIPINFNFLKPESKEDENYLRVIANMMRTLAIGTYGGDVIHCPIEWNVEFISLPDYDRFLRYKNCGIESISVKFGGEGEEFKTMKSGLPFMSMSITFNEKLYPTKNDITL